MSIRLFHIHLSLFPSVRLQDQQYEQRAVDRGERERDEAHQVALRREADEDDLR